MRSPKLANDRSNDWYRYYAGYSPAFVEDVLAGLELGPDAVVLDPWNGSGTTTAVAQSRGVAAVGYDANPALVIIARSRLLGPEVADSVMPLVDDLIDHARLFDLDGESKPDPLHAWFDTNAVREARGIECAIRHVLVEHGEPALGGKEQLDGVSALAAFFYVALFDAVRSKLRSFVGSNPTWVKMAAPESLLSLSPGALHDAFHNASERLVKRLRTHELLDGAALARVELANSSAMPIEAAAVCAVITSPPYCTRIDYVAATRPELAVLGLSQEQIRALRVEMIGTPTIAPITPEATIEWGATVNTLVDKISGHASRASGTYYRKYFLQYFASMSTSLKELRRVLSRDGRAVIVVQDSFYKDVHIDLPKIIQEMSESVGFSLRTRRDFNIATTKAAIHPGARSWRSTFTATESVLVLT